MKTAVSELIPPQDCGGGGGNGSEQNGTTTASYGSNGNMTGGFDGSAYTYDAAGRLTSASKGGVSESFYYDGLGRQVARVVNGVATYSVYDGWDLVAEYTAGSLSGAWVHGVGGIVKELTSGDYYYQDGSGSTSHLADGEGNLLEWYRYDLHGTPIVSDDPTATVSAFGVRHLFTGQQWHGELGLYDLRNRYYSPDLGRFLQPDPIGFAGDANNLYRYGANNPVNRSDPYGTFSLFSWFKGLLRSINGIFQSAPSSSSPSSSSSSSGTGGSYTDYSDYTPTGSHIPQSRTATPNGSLWGVTYHDTINGTHDAGNFALVSGGSFGSTPTFVPAVEITRSGTLQVDDDGTGARHGDPHHDDETAYTPDGQSLNADVDPYVALPTSLVSPRGVVRLGDTAILIVNGISASGVVGDTGANPNLVEASIAMVHNAGVPTVDRPGGPVPNTRGGRDIDATMIIFLTRYGFY